MGGSATAPFQSSSRDSDEDARKEQERCSRLERLKLYQFKPSQSANPNGQRMANHR
ncbi:MAG: hypothetical protein ACETWD_07945 [Desulfatiglandales bacterium]